MREFTQPEFSVEGEQAKAAREFIESSPQSPARPTEVTSKAKRRFFTVDYKRKVQREADACRESGPDRRAASVRGAVLLARGGVAGAILHLHLRGESAALRAIARSTVALSFPRHLHDRARVVEDRAAAFPDDRWDESAPMGAEAAVPAFTVDSKPLGSVKSRVHQCPPSPLLHLEDYRPP